MCKLQLHAHIHTYMHPCIHTYMRTYIHTYIHTYMRTCIRAYIHTCIHTSMHTYIHTYVRMYIYIHTDVHTYICMHAHMYIHTHVCTDVRTFRHKGIPRRVNHIKNRHFKCIWVFHLALVMCWTVRLFYNLFCDSTASLRVCYQFNSLSTFQRLQNTFIICRTSLASSLLAYLEPFLFSCEVTKNFITDINLICTTLFCIDFAFYESVFLNASLMCQMGFFVDFLKLWSE